MSLQIFRTFLIVGLGSFLGGGSRYLTNIFAQKYFLTGFPIGTFIANVLGCFLIGVFFAISEKTNVISPEWRLFLTTGFCGGYTTFSTFSIESINLLRSKEIFYFSLNLGLSVVAGLLATLAGIFIIRIITK
jgi:CrcB protein